MGIKLKTPKIETESIILRALKLEDAKEIYLIRSNEENLKYVNMTAYADVARAERFINAVKEDIKEGVVSFWGISLKDRDMCEKVIGTICIFEMEDKEKSLEIGYEMHCGFKRRGIMTEAMKAVIEFAFREFDINTISAETHEDNEASKRLIEKLGFVESDEVEGKMRYYYLSKE